MIRLLDVIPVRAAWRGPIAPSRRIAATARGATGAHARARGTAGLGVEYARVMHDWIRRSPSAAVAVALVAVLAGAACKQHRPRSRWGIGVQTFDATALGLAHARSPDPFVDAIRPGRLTIPTYDGSNQATHPDVLVERDAAGVHVT